MLELRWPGDQALLPASDLNGVNTRGFGEGERLTVQMKEEKKEKIQKEGEGKGKKRKKREKIKRTSNEDRRESPPCWLFNTRFHRNHLSSISAAYFCQLTG